MNEDPVDCTPSDAYSAAIEAYKARRRELSECELAIDEARFRKDTPTLRVALSKRGRLQDLVIDAKERVMSCAVDVVRHKGMTETEKPEQKAGLLQQLIGKILQS